MNITISHPEFKTQLLELRVSGRFDAPLVLLNGAVVRRSDRVYTVLNDAGHEVSITLNSNIFYHLPQCLIEQESIKITGKAGWRQFAGWQKTWIAQLFFGLLRVPVMLLRIKKVNRTI
jgi:hypothetical protein